MKEQILGIVRHILTFAGGIAVTKGLLDEAMLEQVLGGIMTLAGAIWSIVSKQKA